MLFFIKQIEMIEITLISVVCVALLTAKATKITETSFDKGRIIMNLNTGVLYLIQKVEILPSARMPSTWVSRQWKKTFRVVVYKETPFVYSKERSTKDTIELDIVVTADGMKGKTNRMNQDYYENFHVFDDEQMEQFRKYLELIEANLKAGKVNFVELGGRNPSEEE